LGKVKNEVVSVVGKDDGVTNGHAEPPTYEPKFNKPQYLSSGVQPGAPFDI